MTTDNPSSFPVRPSQHNSIQSTTRPLGGLDHELSSNAHLPGIHSTYSTMDTVNPLPPTRHGYPSSTWHDDPPYLATGPVEHQGNQGQCQLDGYGTPQMTQYIPIAPGPPLLGQYAPTIPETANDGSPSDVPLPQPMAGPSRGNPRVLHSRMSAAEDLKDVAMHYLHNPRSYVDKLRMRRSRSSAVKVLISLEIDDL